MNNNDDIPNSDEQCFIENNGEIVNQPKRIITSIPLKKSTHVRLRDYGKKSETWDEVLNRLMDMVDKNRSE